MESYAQTWDYVRENPVRASLVSTAEKWKYQGEIVEIDHALGSAARDGGSYNAPAATTSVYGDTGCWLIVDV